MRALLDTQVLVIASLAPANLSKKVLSLLEQEGNDFLLSSASLMEIAIKNMIGKIAMPEQAARQAIRDLRLSVVPFNERHAYQMFTLPSHHRDPFDRMIISTAMVEGVPLVGSDRQFRLYKGLQHIW